MTRSFRRSLGIGAALAFLALGSPVDGAAADSHFDASSEQGFGDDPLANPGLQRSAEVPVEPTGPPARSAARGIVNCGEVITKNTTLLRDVGPCPGNGIIVGADNIMLNLNGYTISGTPGPGDGNQAGIRLPNRSGVTVTGLPGGSGKKGTVTGFDGGVVVGGGSGNTIENLIVRDNNGPARHDTFLGDGILILRSSNNHVRNNDLLRNGIWSAIGVWGTGANGNAIEGNLVEGTAGVRMTGENDMGPYTYVDGVVGGEGIKVMWALSGPELRRGPRIVNNTVTNNVSRRNDASGISLWGSEQGSVAGNTVEDNGQAWFASQWADKYRFVARFVNSAGNGIEAYPHPRSYSSELLVEGNTSFRNFRHGIYIYWMDVTRIANNSTGYNGVLDLVDHTPYGGGCSSVWFGNTWGPLSSWAAENGYASMAYPECTQAGGSGPVLSGS